jgi:hypothetical protein
MFYLKKKVTNKAKVEGSIYEAYLIDEITNFASHYFGDDVQTIWNQVPRNDDGGLKSVDGCLSIFSLFFPIKGKNYPKDFIEGSCHMLKCKLRITM